MAGPLGSTPGIIVGVGVGTAAADALEPAFERARQDAWRKNAVKELEPGIIARLVAQGAMPLDRDAYNAAGGEGFGPDKLDALVYLSQTVPGFGQALELYRRDPQGFADLWTHALVKNGIDARYLPHLNELRDDRLSPPVVALAIVRGILRDPGFLPVGPPTGTGKVAAFPTSPLNALEEAQSFGFNPDRLFVQTAISGRPMGPEAAAQAVFKGILEHVDYQRAISEGDVRNEWADAIFENMRPIPSVLDGVQGHLRGWLTEPEMFEQAHRHGMADADTSLLFKIHGRPPSWHQIWIGLQRGGTYDGPITDIHPAFLKGLRESDLRPEWYNLLWHSRYSYPSPFVLRQLTSSGAITQADAEQVLHFEGYEPTFAAKIAAAWAGAGTETAATDPTVKKAQTSLFTALHRSYVNRESDAAAVRPGLTALGVTAQAQSDVLGLWELERNLIHAELSPTQIRKAVNGGIVNPSTGQPWSHADGHAALLARGYTSADAETFLAE